MNLALSADGLTNPCAPNIPHISEVLVVGRQSRKNLRMTRLINCIAAGDQLILSYLIRSLVPLRTTQASFRLDPETLERTGDKVATLGVRAPAVEASVQDSNWHTQLDLW
jgi:hypothetical protein